MSTAVVLALVTFVSLKQVTCDVSEVLGYNYLPPQPPPVQFDEPSTPPNTYLPPIFQDEIFPAAPAPGYLPPAFYPPLGTPPSDPNDDDTVVVPAPTPISLYKAVPPQMKILNMSCVLDTSFKTSFRLERKGSNFPIPVVDNGVEDCVRFDPPNTFSIDVEGRKKLSECGVMRCTSGTSPRSNMCVTIRMPAIRGIKLPEDGLVTLQCTPQDPVVSHTKHISLSPMTSSKGRSTNNVVVASGGSQRNFDSRLLLLRKSGRSGNFDQPLQPGSIVILGEELVLRAVVQDGDGWKFSRLGPVMVRSPNSKKSVTLVEENGCRSPGMRSICPHQPQQLSPLDTLLHFRAFLFQDSSRKQDMLLSVRMLGCIHPQDCYQNGPCSDDKLAPPLRFKRDAGGNSSLEKNGTSDWKSQFIFKVQMPEEPNQPVKTVSVSIEFLLLASMFTLCLIAIIILATIHLVRKQSRQNVR